MGRLVKDKHTKFYFQPNFGNVSHIGIDYASHSRFSF